METINENRIGGGQTGVKVMYPTHLNCNFHHIILMNSDLMIYLIMIELKLLLR